MSEATTEKRIVAACLKSREAFGKIKKHLDVSQFSPYGEWTIEQATTFYEKDPSADSVDAQHLLDLTKLKFDNPSKANLYAGYIENCAAVDVSPLNLADLILEAKRKVKGSELSMALANDPGSKRVKELVEEFQDLTLEDNDEKEEGPEVLVGVSVEEINKSVLSPEGQIKLSPRVLNEAVGGGVLEGHHIVVLARPETGKTALCLTLLRGFVLQKLPGIYFGNEDPILSVIERAQGCISGIEREARIADPKAAYEVLEKSGYGLASFVPIHPGSLSEITKHVIRLKPKWIIVDQIRNLNVGGETRVNQLEMAAQGIRNIAKKFNLVAISVTQAGDSADGKLVLGMGDVDFSNTGIPATADLMIGIGINDEFERNKQVMISLPKNKLTGKHEHFQVRRNEKLSRLESL